jgi:hypothetical protein
MEVVMTYTTEAYRNRTAPLFLAHDGLGWVVTESSAMVQGQVVVCHGTREKCEAYARAASRQLISK